MPHLWSTHAQQSVNSLFHCLLGLLGCRSPFTVFITQLSLRRTRDRRITVVACWWIKNYKQLTQDMRLVASPKGAIMWSTGRLCLIIPAVYKLEDRNEWNDRKYQVTLLRSLDLLIVKYCLASNASTTALILLATSWTVLVAVWIYLCIPSCLNYLYNFCVDFISHKFVADLSAHV